MNRNVLVIPTYNPTQSLADLIPKLSPEFTGIVVVNDGSCNAESAEILRSISENHSIIVLHHLFNQGKGEALKTGFNYCLEHLKFDFVITADSDGQHLAEDIISLSKFSTEVGQSELILGQRQFLGKIPFRSRIGNLITSLIFRLIYQLPIADTQTGLRAIKKCILEPITLLQGSRYEFESDMLVWAVKNRILISIKNIKTVYIDGNSSSHFRPAADSIRIYKSLLGFSASSFSSFLIDYFVFSILFFFSGSIVWSATPARLLSGFFNFKLNRKLLLGVKSKVYRHALLYFILFIFILVGSVYGTQVLVLAGWNTYVSKIAVDSVLFFMSFLTQRKIFN